MDAGVKKHPPYGFVTRRTSTLCSFLSGKLSVPMSTSWHLAEPCRMDRDPSIMPLTDGLSSILPANSKRG